MSEKYLCRWCDRQVNAVITERENKRIAWVGCVDCYTKRKGVKEDVKASE